MSDDSGSEKIYPASPRKRQEARKKGQVARSAEFSSALVVLALIFAVRYGMQHGIVFDSLVADLHSAFVFNPHPLRFDLVDAHQWQLKILLETLQLVGPPMLAALCIGMIVSVAQVGLQITPEALKFDFNRVNPSTGFKRIFSGHGAVELAKGLIKMVVIGTICYSTINDSMPFLAGGMELPLVPFLSKVGELIWSLTVHVCFALFIVAMADYAFQKYDFEKNMRMTRDEMKQEMKQTEGDPMVKQHIRKRQREMSQKRMMEKVPTADVVVTNPTHFAVALKYEPGSMGAPRVVARGVDLVAQTIKEIAKEHKVPTVENRTIARALYYDVPLGKEIPAELYQAVAEILAFVYKMKRR